MTEELNIPGATCRVKIRKPATIALLSVVTLGVYQIYWWYTINRELRDLGRSRNATDLGESPGVSAVAFALGWCVVVPLVWTAVTTNRRIKAAMRLIGASATRGIRAAVILLVVAAAVGAAGLAMHGWAPIAASAIAVAVSVGAIVCMQLALNKVWRALSDAEPASPPGRPSERLAGELMQTARAAGPESGR